MTLRECKFGEKLMDGLRCALKTERLFDCSFIVGQEPQQQIFKGHKLILATCSPVFGAMFYGKLAETNYPIPIPDIQPETFKILLKYMYTGKISEKKVDSFAICELWYCADKYIVQDLMQICIRYLEFNLSPKSACRVYECAKVFKDKELMYGCVDIIRVQTSEVLKESSWEDVELETLIKILEQDDLLISSEIELFTGLERWAKSECCRKSLDPTNGECLRSVIGNALLKIRFLCLTMEEFVNGPSSSSLLTKDESYAILENIKGTNIVPMPKDFCTKWSRGKNPFVHTKILYEREIRPFCPFIEDEDNIKRTKVKITHIDLSLHVQIMGHNGEIW